MADWNSEQYLKFKAQRTQPAIDLAARLRSRKFYARSEKPLSRSVCYRRGQQC